MEVKIMKFGRVQEYSLSPGSTVEDLFEIAEEVFDNGTVTRRGSTVCLDTVLYQGDSLFIGEKVKGNVDGYLEVKFLPLGGRTFSLTATEGQTIKEVLNQLSEEERSKFYNADGKSRYEFRIKNSRSFDDSRRLTSDDVDANSGLIKITCSQRTKGNE